MSKCGDRVNKKHIKITREGRLPAVPPDQKLGFEFI
jgi:hypothetical protein